MRFEPAPLAGLFLVRAEPWRDARGSFERLYCPEEFAAAGAVFAPVQWSLSRNPQAGTLRGLHFQDPPHAEAKFVRPVRGRIFDVAVDLRPQSPTFRRWFGAELSAEAGEAMVVPAGFAHGFLTREPDSDVLYGIDRLHVPGKGRGIRWDDPAIGIAWPEAPRLVSEADRGWALLGG